MVDNMNPGLDILYLGHDYGTSRHRAEAIRRIGTGNKVEILNPWSFFPKDRILKKVIEKIIHEIGAAWVEPYIKKRLSAILKGRHFEVIWSDQCELIGPEAAAILRSHSDHMVTYAIDDPFGARDKKRFTLYLKSLSKYDLVVVVRKPCVNEAYLKGARRVLRVFRSADEVVHRPFFLTTMDKKKWESDVTFVGTWMVERGPLMLRLVELGVPLTIYGDRWQKAREWTFLKRFWRGPGLVGDPYVKAIQSAKICLGLLSKGNRDLHTTRSVEITYIGSLLCAERTMEHSSMYLEDKEAVFWNSPEECAEKCFSLLADDDRRKAIAKAGRRRCLLNGHFNEPTVKVILKTLFLGSPEKILEKRRSKKP